MDNDNAVEKDPAVALNNFLQEHPTGNLTPFFKYDMTTEGPPNQITHIATAKFRGVTYAVKRATAKGVAKRDAAKHVLDYFKENGVPGPEGA
ncbi:hypothetical protein BJV74DRAFT_886994 [Russula compacta]|nr:hypothetical protein BJV74DRAFT_886994 [Russula compacta]